MAKPANVPDRFGKHESFPGQGNAKGRPAFVDDKIPFDRDPAVAVSIDAGFPSPTPRVVTFDAGDGAYAYSDRYLNRTWVQINNFGSNDVINVTGASASDYQFATIIGREQDLAITALIGAETYAIFISNVVPAGAVVTDYASAVAALGREFMTFDNAPILPPNTCWAGSLDYGTLGDVPIFATAANMAYCFQEDHTVQSNVAVFGMGTDDNIDIGFVAGGDPDNEYLFSAVERYGTDRDDLLMRSYVTNADGSQTITGEILLVDLLGNGAAVTDYDSAVAAAGYFFVAFSPAIA